ncbi:MAG: alpha/beta hydrolase [Pseudomonadota bacterium]
MSIALAIAALILLAPLLAEAMRAATGLFRPKASASLAHLPNGATHYTWSGPETGPVVVCIHGISTPSFVFAATERSLAALGYRVLTYDLYGRGHSAHPVGKQDAAFFLSQLEHLLQHQEVTDEITVLGFSMGGQIAAAFTAENPDRVNRLILVASSGLAPTETTGQNALWTAPLIGDWLTITFGGIALRRELVEHLNFATVVPNYEDLQAAQTRQRGYLPAILSSRRHLLGKSAASDHKRIARARIPVLALWASDDPNIPLAAMGALAQINPEAQHVQIPGAGHSLLQTHPREIAEALKDHLTN